MDNIIRVSVLVPVYNAERFIIRCVDSVLGQTFTEYELLLINDGSTDGSGIICDELAEKDSRIRVIHKNNTGVSDTRNWGLREAKGEYIYFLDSDDYIDNHMLEIMYESAIKEHSDIVMCQYYIDNAGEITLVDMDYEAQYNTSEEIKNKLIYRYYTDSHEGLYTLCNKLIRRSLYVDNNICVDVERKRGEDAWFVFACLKHARKVVYIPQGFYYYYQNQNSIMHKVYLDQYQQWVYSRKELLLENEELKFDIDYNLFYKEFLYKVSVYCRDLSKLGEKELLKNILQESFYREILEYRRKLPFHIRLLGGLVVKGRIKLAMLLYKIWGIM